MQMKNSNIPWIGEIPSDWEVVRLRFLCKIITGSKDTINKKDNGIYPFYVRSPIVEKIDTYTFDGEAILMAGDGVGAGKVFHYVNGKFDYHQRVYNLHGFNNIYGMFLHYYLSQNFWKEIEQSNAKSTVDSIRLPMLLNFPVCLPPLKTQQKIAGFLDAKCSKIDSTIEQEKKQIVKLKEYRQSLITEAVTKGINPNVPMKDSGIEWIGEIPQGWEATKLKNLVRLISDKSSYSNQLYIGLENILPNGGKYVEIESQHIEGISTQFQKNDVLFAKLRPYLAKCIIAKKNGLCSSEFLVLRNFKGDSRLLRYFLIAPSTIEAITASTYGTKMPRANWSFIGEILFPLPPLEEQKQIADYLDTKTAQIDNAITKKETLIIKLQEYKKSLIFEAVTGKI